MNKTKRVLSVVLAVLMLSSLIAALAIADNETCNVEIKYVFASDQNKQAAHSWTAKVGRGSTLNVSVTSPTVLGYAPKADQATVTINETISNDKTIVVFYYASEVAVTVNHYRQNIDNDGYTLFETENKTGFTDSAVGDRAQQYKGFIALPYDKDELVAADGTTSVEIYYDRNYYLLSLNLDGGYGVEPIYARYGTPISLGEPTKAGYTFKGWEPAAPATMPANGAALTAQWEADKTAKVSVVVWGENADDEAYSYIQSVEMTGTVGENFTITEDGKLICTKEEHTHSTACEISCTHTHTAACYGGTKQEEPIDGKTNSAAENISQFKALTGGTLQNGMVYRVKCDGATTTNGYDKYYLYYGNTWYSVDASNVSGSAVASSQKVNAHSHSGNIISGNNKDQFWVYNSKLSCTHTHTDSCYACGKTEHTHDSDCYFNGGFGLDNLWKLVKSDTVEVTADGSTVVNVYYDRTEFTLTFNYDYKNSSYRQNSTITAKWGADIGDEFLAVSSKANGSLWSKNVSGGDPWTSFLQIMPAEDRTYYCRNTSSTAQPAYYYTEDLNGEYVLKHTVNAYYGKDLGISSEDFYPMEGFTYDHGFDGAGDKLPSPDDIDDTNVAYPWNGAKFYYKRNSYDLVFISNNTEVKTSKVKFEAALSTSDGANFVPAYPSNFEPNAFEFAGWYQDPEGVKPVDWDAKMPAASVTVYAKWAPVQHTVKTWLTDKMDTPVNVGETGSNVQTVAHRDTAVAPAEPTHEPYAFIGWFYKDENGADKAFDFSMPVTRDLDLFAKWSSNVMVEYTIKYMLKDANGNETTTEVAAPTTGNALDGVNKTFEAKAGEELYADYRTGYLPETNSHAMTISVDAEHKNEYIFWYVARAKAAYTVRYLDTATGEPVVVDGKPTPDKHDETSAAIITERFLQINGYAPDAFQKRLILSATEAENVITFWYTKDEVHAPVHVIHWTQNIANDDYTEYQSSTDLNGVIGQSYTENPLEIPGFTYNAGMSKASGTLTKDGLELNLYYDRNIYDYEFRFVDRDGNPIEGVDTVTGKARYQAQVTERAKKLEGDGWMLDTTRCSENGAINIVIEKQPDKNVYTFYYLPFYNIVHVKSGVAGDPVKTVIPNNNKDGLTDKVSDGYLYGGTFDYVDCTTVHDFGQENAINFTPVKGETYYIWEVSETYLKPRTYAVSKHLQEKNGQLCVVELYLMTHADRQEYQYMGFEIVGENAAISDRTVYEVVNATKGGNLYQQMYVGLDGNMAASKTEVVKADRRAGYIAMYKLDANQFAKFKTGGLTFQPYWVTLDGIIVRGVNSRNCTYKGDGETQINADNQARIGSNVGIYTNASQQTIDVAYSYVFEAADVEVVTPEVPETPEIPEVPEAPEMTLNSDAMYLRAQYTYEMMTNTVKFISAIDVNECTEYGFVINGEVVKCEETAETVDGYDANYLFGGSVNGAMLMSCNMLLDGLVDGMTLNVTPYYVALDGTVVYGETRTLVYRQWVGLEG